MLNSALTLAEFGYSVFPALPCSKQPAVNAWKNYQTTAATTDQIVAWWESMPNANIAVVCGPVSGGLVVLDIDAPALNAWPPIGHELPDCPISLTGGGGRQYWMRAPAGTNIGCSTSRLAQNVDIKAAGGYVIAPPSVHPNGTPYCWAIGHELTEAAKLPEMPTWLVAALTNSTPTDTAKTPIDTFLRLLNGVPEGQRNAAATRLAGHYLALGLPTDEVLELLIGWNARNRPPLPDTELRAVVNSIAKRECARQQVAACITGSNPITSTPPANLTDEQRATILQEIAEHLGVPLKNITRIEGDEPYYIFQVGDNIARLSARDMVSCTAFARAITAAAARVPNICDGRSKMGRKWPELANLLMSLATPQEKNEESTVAGSLKLLLRDYLQQNPKQKNGETDSVFSPIQKNGELLISFTEFLHFCKIMRAYNGTIHAFAQMLAEMGIHRKTVQITKSDGTRIITNLYVIPRALEASLSLE